MVRNLLQVNQYSMVLLPCQDNGRRRSIGVARAELTHLAFLKIQPRVGLDDMTDIFETAPDVSIHYFLSMPHTHSATPHSPSEVR
ncbi:hypothetical protein H2248_000012 [Termitomyces sp. 'cryptogamus']|nr:hypothetical protein H2248_000012 [Termitomyces sp. 'cryptogamus']